MQMMSVGYIAYRMDKNGCVVIFFGFVFAANHVNIDDHGFTLLTDS